MPTVLGGCRAPRVAAPCLHALARRVTVLDPVCAGHRSAAGVMACRGPSRSHHARRAAPRGPVSPPLPQIAVQSAGTCDRRGSVLCALHSPERSGAGPAQAGRCGGVPCGRPRPRERWHCPCGGVAPRRVSSVLLARSLTLPRPTACTGPCRALPAPALPCAALQDRLEGLVGEKEDAMNARVSREIIDLKEEMEHKFALQTAENKRLQHHVSPAACAVWHVPCLCPGPAPRSPSCHGAGHCTAARPRLVRLATRRRGFGRRIAAPRFSRSPGLVCPSMLSSPTGTRAPDACARQISLQKKEGERAAAAAMAMQEKLQQLEREVSGE